MSAVRPPAVGAWRSKPCDTVEYTHVVTAWDRPCDGGIQALSSDGYAKGSDTGERPDRETAPLATWERS